MHGGERGVMGHMIALLSCCVDFVEHLVELWVVPTELVLDPAGRGSSGTDVVELSATLQGLCI